MNGRRLNIVHVASEVAPYSKTGGLADIANSLPKALHRLGHQVTVVTPLYGQVIEPERSGLRPLAADIAVRLNSVDAVKVSFWQGEIIPGLPIFFIEQRKYFSRSKLLYGSPHENARFLVFNAAVFRLLTFLKLTPDIIQCHDWHTGLIPYYLRTGYRPARPFRQAKTLFTIHNLTYQLGHNWWEIPTAEKDYGRTRLPHLSEPALERVNFAKRAILAADAINTVSPSYRVEIMTRRFGQDLHRILKNRQHRLYGIINGIDYRDYNPENDPGLWKRYSFRRPSGKAVNKARLQKMFGLPVEANTPLAAMVMRIAEQKGFDIVLAALPAILSRPFQLVVMGNGDQSYEKRLRALQRKFPGRIGLHLEFNTRDATKVYAGSDLFLQPSRFEPCGLTQMIALRYGSVPVVNHTGGLADTITDYDARTGRGNGFVFHGYDQNLLTIAITRAVETYRRPEAWRELVRRDMQQSYSWEIPARKYVELYKNILTAKNSSPTKQVPPIHQGS